jgi:hypothetical protein
MKLPAHRFRHRPYGLVVITLLAAMGASLGPDLVLGPSVGASEHPSSTHPKVHFTPNFNPKLPPAASGCHGAEALSGGGEKLPLTVSSGGDGLVAATVNVCVDGRGPFPFILDSGAFQTVIDAGLAHRLHLPTISHSRATGIGGCIDQLSVVTADSWSVDGLSLAPQTFSADTETGQGGKGQTDGLLGNDVLSRFGAVRIDFDAGALVLPGPEGAPLSTSAFTGPRGPVPTELTKGQGVVVPAEASTGPVSDYLSVPVRFGGEPTNWFVVDTGTGRTTVDPWVSKEGSLRATDLTDLYGTVCSTLKAPIVHSGPWSVSGVTLRPQLVDSLGTGVSSDAGILGADTLAHEKWVVLDYTGGLVVLG